jgi:hypothetical protein
MSIHRRSCDSSPLHSSSPRQGSHLVPTAYLLWPVHMSCGRLTLQALLRPVLHGNLLFIISALVSVMCSAPTAFSPHLWQSSHQKALDDEWDSLMPLVNHALSVFKSPPVVDFGLHQPEFSPLFPPLGLSTSFGGKMVSKGDCILLTEESIRLKSRLIASIASTYHVAASLPSSVSAAFCRRS